MNTKNGLPSSCPIPSKTFVLLTPVTAGHIPKFLLKCRNSEQWCYSMAISIPQICAIYGFVFVHTFFSGIFILFFKKDWWKIFCLFLLSLEFNNLELSELCFTCSHVFPGKEQNSKLNLFLLDVFLFCDKHKVCSWCHESSRCRIQLTLPSRKVSILPGLWGDMTMIHFGDNTAGTQVQLFAM